MENNKQLQEKEINTKVIDSCSEWSFYDDSDIDSEIEHELYCQLHYSSTVPAATTIEKTKKVMVKDSDEYGVNDSNDDDDSFILIDDEDAEADENFHPWEVILTNKYQTAFEGDDKIEMNLATDEGDTDSINDFSALSSFQDSSKPPPSFETGNGEAERLFSGAASSSGGGGGLKNRFFHEDNRQCKNCHGVGHVMRECPKPIKRKPCLICASKDHQQRMCPYKLHLPRVPYNVVCHRCNGKGHLQSECPDLWRQYHLTTEPGQIRRHEQAVPFPTRKSCFNCGNRGHFGHECVRPTMNGNTIPYPLVRVYDKHTNRNRHQLQQRRQHQPRFNGSRIVKRQYHSHAGGMERRAVRSYDQHSLDRNFRPGRSKYGGAGNKFHKR